MSEWMEAENTFNNRKGDPVPKGWKSVQEYANEKSPPMNLSSASSRLKMMCDEGVLERKLWRMQGVNRSVYIYRPIVKK